MVAVAQAATRLVRRCASPSLPRYFACLAAGYTLVAIYGSLVPLDFSWPADGVEAASRAWAEFRARRAVSLFDVAANVALFVPLGFLWSAAALYAGSRGQRGARSLLIISAAAILSAIIEWLQLALPARTVSPLDILAETTGAAIGCAAWWLTGRPLSIWLAQYQASEPRGRLINGALQLYLFAVTVWWLMPLDLSCRPGELAGKLRSNVMLKPFSDITPERGLGVALAFALFIPVGVLVATSGRSHAIYGAAGHHRWPVLGLMTLLTAGQFFVMGRVTDILEVAALGMGMAAGAWLVGTFREGLLAGLSRKPFVAQRLVREQPSSNTWQNGPSSLTVKYLLYLLVLFAVLVGLIGAALAVNPGDRGLVGRRFPNWEPTWPILCYWSVVIGALAIVPRWPVFGSMIFALLTYGVFHRGHSAAEFFRALGGPDLVPILGLAGVWLARSGEPRPLRLPLLINGLAASYGLWALISAAYLWLDGRAWNEEVTIQCFRLINCAMVFAMTSLVVPTQHSHGWLSAVLTVGILLPGVLYPEGMFRNHVTATMIAIILPLTLHLLLTSRSMVLQILLGLACIKLMGMLYVGQSRSAIGGAAVGLALYAALSHWRIWLLAAFVPAGILVWRLTRNSQVTERFAALFHQQPGWDTGRIELWEFAWDAFRTFPVFGMGPGTGPEGFNDVHNSYLAALSETGAVGLALYMLFWLVTIYFLVRLIWNAGDHWAAPAAKAILASIVAYLVAGLGYSLHAQQLGFLLAGWGLALAAAPACVFLPDRRADSRLAA